MTETEHLLSCLAEECAEVSVRVSKALRFGLTEVQPGQGLTNSARIADELSDLAGVIEMLNARGALQWSTSKDEQVAVKIKKVTRFMAYARECGALEREG